MTPPKAHFLILGGTGSIGYAFAQEVLRRSEQATLLVRNLPRAEKLFGPHATLKLIEGDVQDLSLLKRLAEPATHIFHGINYPYAQ